MEQEGMAHTSDPSVPSRGGGHRLAIRPVTADDADKLAALYDGLDADDRYLRFFSHHRPSPEFVERVATEGERGGAGLVAAMIDEQGNEGQFVGEVGFTLLPDGNGELALTVTPNWRGWLGPYLLDALSATAAARGVSNLESDVMTADHAMLAMLRRRGAVTMEHTGWSVVRLLIGTSTAIPSWAGSHDAPRMLVEVPGGRWDGEDEARAAGFEVLTCSGPTARRCPALAGETCALAAGADAIVVAHPRDDEFWPRLVESHELVHPGAAVRLEPCCLDPASRTPPG